MGGNYNISQSILKKAFEGFRQGMVEGFFHPIEFLHGRSGLVNPGQAELPQRVLIKAFEQKARLTGYIK
jgi:hypothetical protein